jgi:TusA-related sulfurtransferase
VTLDPKTGEPVVTLDERGRRCPLPVLALARACQQHPPGTSIAVISDDPAAEHDIPAWCRLKGASFLGQYPAPDGGAGAAFLVRSAASG